MLGKGNKERVVYFSLKAQLHLKRYLESRADDCEALFATVRKPYRRMSNRSIQRLVKVIGKRAGIENIHPHKFRRTITSVLLSNGADIYVVKELLGHESIDTTLKNYTKLSKSFIKQSYERHLIQ